MKLAFLIDELGGGGAERTAVVLANNLSLRGIDTYILTGKKIEKEYNLEQSVKREVLYNKRSFLFNIVALHRFLKQNDIDICVAVGIYANLVASASNIGIKTKVILYEQNSPKDDEISWRSKLLRKLFFWRSDAHVFQTAEEMSFYGKTIQRKGVVIPNPLMEGLPQRSSKHKKEIIAIGRLRPQKNYPVLLEAFSVVVKKYPEYTLRIFGKGTDRPLLEKQIEVLGIKKNVVFEGFTLNVHQAIVDSDIYVLSSDFEGMPNTLMEAMGMGFPVVSTDCGGGGPRALIRHKENGLLVPVRNSQALAESILEYLDNPNIKEQYAQNAYSSIKAMCDLGIVIGIWIDFFSKMLNNEIFNE